jgi:acetyltransferase
MAIHPYPVELETTLSTREGLKFCVRPIRPDDADAEQAFVSGLSEETRYLRFMDHMHELTPPMLARFTQVDYDRELALVVLDGRSRPDRIVGVARYVAYPDGRSAEFAVVVADELQGKGVGYGLMRLLIAAARERGLERLVGYVLAINAPMLKLMAALGFEAGPDPGDREQVIVTLELDGGRNSRKGEKGQSKPARDTCSVRMSSHSRADPPSPSRKLRSFSERDGWSEQCQESGAIGDRSSS